MEPLKMPAGIHMGARSTKGHNTMVIPTKGPMVLQRLFLLKVTEMAPGMAPTGNPARLKVWQLAVLQMASAETGSLKG
jgi:hypothetical protein